MGLDINSCCRLCLANAAGPNATHIDLADQQEVSEIIQELYGLKINSSGRGSKLLCIACYKKTIDLKKHISGHRTKANLVSLNQAILQAQVAAFPEPESDDDAPVQEGYNAPSSSGAQLFLLVDDCMRSERFQDRLTDRYDLLHLRISGPIFQSATSEFVDMWFPEELRCDRCFTPFESREELALHLEVTCKFKCNFCRRTYSFLESFGNHVCPKRDRFAKEKRKRMSGYSLKTIGKRCRLDTGEFEEKSKESGKEAEKLVAEKPAEKNDLKLVPVSRRASLSSGLARSEGEANLDVELSNLLERWYGQNEELEELTGLDLEAIEPASNGAIATATPAAPKPAISVKPMSQLIGSTPQQPLLQPAAIDTRPYNDVIEIEDEADNSRAVVPALAQQPQQQLAKPDQQSLSESDILNIVKHFRGIDENESYLIKAKINGASKLICISKRKGEGDTVPSATIVNNNSSGQANGNSNSSGTSKPPQATVPALVRRPSSPPPLVPTKVTNPALNRRPIMKYVPPRSHIKHTTGSINGPNMTPNIPPQIAATSIAQSAKKTGTTIPLSQVPPMPQLKIAHVESLVTPNAMGHQQQQQQPQPRVLNGQILNPGMQTFNRSAAPIAIKAKSPGTIPPVNPGQPLASKQPPRRIIVGSNSIKMMNSTHPRSVLAKSAIQSVVRSPPKPVVTTTSTQQRIVVQRKQVKTVVQSTVRRTSVGAGATPPVALPPQQVSPGLAGNSMLRTQLMQPQQPPRSYPGPSGQNAGVASSADQLLTSLASSNRQFKLNNTTFKRLD